MFLSHSYHILGIPCMGFPLVPLAYGLECGRALNKLLHDNSSSDLLMRLRRSLAA